MTRFREDGRLREWTADPTDPLPQGLAEITRLTPEEFSVRRGRVALASIFPSEKRNGITDGHLLRLLQFWPEFAWTKGTQVENLEPFIESTFRVIRGERPEAVATSLSMSPDEYTTWRGEVAKDLSSVVSLKGLGRAAGLREATKPRRKTLKNDIERPLAGRQAGSRTWIAPSQPVSPKKSREPIQRTGSRYADFVSVVAARDDPNLFGAMLIDYIPIIRLKANGYFLAGGEQEDLVQEGMIGFYQAVRDYNGMGSSFRSFADLCISRQIITAIKTATRFKHAPLNTYASLETHPIGHSNSDDPLTIGEVLPDGAPSVPDIVESTEGLMRIVSILKTELSPLEEAVLKLFLEDVTYKEIAAALGQDTKSVDNAIQRVKRKLEAARLDKDFVSPLLKTG